MQEAKEAVITINKFLQDYGVKKWHLAQYGISYHQIAKYGSVDLDELPVDIHMSFMAILTKYGYFCEGLQ